MTENEIFEALRSRIKDIEELEKNCFIPKGMLPKLETYIIDLINRKNAEIERLNKELKEAYSEQANYEDMILEGVEVCARCHEKYDEKIKQAEVAAIKKFATSLKDYYIKDKRYKRPHASTMIIFLFDLIDNLVKEKTGGLNNG